MKYKKLLPAGITAVLFFHMIIAQADRTAVEAIAYADGVTEEMCNPAYWAKLAKCPDEILLSVDEIAAMNQAIVLAPGTHMHNLEEMDTGCDVEELRESLSLEAVPEKEMYVNGKLLTDKDSYFAALKNNIKRGTAIAGDKDQNALAGYMICVGRADVRVWPTADHIGYSKTDMDDEFESSILNVNEPFVAELVTADGKFCWGYTVNCTGWVEMEKLALCRGKEEWLDSWKVTDENILVVIKDKVLLEHSMLEPEVSETALMLGTVLKLVPRDEIPVKIGDRGIWNNYVVFLPVRDENGYYQKRMALISQHEQLSEGYLPLTQANILKVAFECLGDRYGWGGMLGAMDCSLYVRSIYRCFGLEIPRNAAWQQEIPGRKTDLSEMDNEKKQAILDCVPAGTLLFFPGHVMMYLGKTDGRYYVINALGKVSDDGDTERRTVYSVVVNTLDVRRADGNTWLSSMSALVAMKASVYDPDISKWMTFFVLGGNSEN